MTTFQDKPKLDAQYGVGLMGVLDIFGIYIKQANDLAFHKENVSCYPIGVRGQIVLVACNIGLPSFKQYGLMFDG